METTFSRYRGITIHWYRIVSDRGVTSYTTAWEFGGEWQHGPEHYDLAVAVRVAERRIDRALARSTGDRRWTHAP